MNLLRFITGDVASIHATFIQAVGLWMFGLLLAVLARPVNREWFTDFAKSFIFLALAVGSLRIAFALGPFYGRVFFIVYFLGEYLFLYFLVVGAGRLAGRPPISASWALGLPGLALAIALSYLPDFSQAFLVQAAIMGAGFFLAFALALRNGPETGRGHGLHLLRFSLFVLGVGFAQYVPIMAMVLREGRELPKIYATFMPVFDLLFEAALAFAMIVAGMESVQSQLIETNNRLERAKEKLDVLARTDPLTELMNRHAFAAVLESPEQVAIAHGSLAVIDLNGLKIINDTYGHQAGDQAIRAFAKALRARLRPDDLIFRWGGDEFLAVLFGLPPAETAARLAGVGEIEVRIDGVERPARITGSHGVAAFSSIGELHAATAKADAAMYDAKRSRRSSPTPL